MRVKTTMIYNRIWKVHPNYPDFAFAENGDVCDISYAPAKILRQYESKDSKSDEPYMRVEVRKKNGERTSLSVVNHLINLYGLRSWEHAQHFSFRYKDGDFRNIHISNLEVYKRHPEFRLLFDDDIKEIVALLEEDKLSQGEIAKKFEVSKDTIYRIAKKALRKKKIAEAKVNQQKRAELELFWKDAPAEIKKLLKKFIVRKYTPKGQKNRSFTAKLVNEKLSNYCVSGIVERISIRRTAPGISAEIEAQVKMLNDYFFGE